MGIISYYMGDFVLYNVFVCIYSPIDRTPDSLRQDSRGIFFVYIPYDAEQIPHTTWEDHNIC